MGHFMVYSYRIPEIPLSLSLSPSLFLSLFLALALSLSLSLIGAQAEYTPWKLAGFMLGSFLPGQVTKEKVSGGRGLDASAGWKLSFCTFPMGVEYILCGVFVYTYTYIYIYIYASYRVYMILGRVL